MLLYLKKEMRLFCVRFLHTNNASQKIPSEQLTDSIAFTPFTLTDEYVYY